MTSNEARLAALYEAFNARKIDAVLAWLHEEVAWPNGWEGGVLHGREAVRDYWIRQWREIDPKVTPEEILELPDGLVRVRVSQVVRNMEGAVLSDVRLDHVYRMQDDRVLSMEIQPL